MFDEEDEEKVYRKLAELPEPVFRSRDWPDYRQLGLGQEDVEDLLELASSFYLEDQQNDQQSALSIHAWRVLVEIGGPELLPEFLTLSIECDLIEDEWFADDFPVLLGKLGMSILPELKKAVDANPEFSCLAEGLILGLPEMASNQAERELAIETLVALFAHQDFDRSLRALIVEALEGLKAVEAIDAIRGQFSKNRIDLSAVGDIEAVEVRMGLREKRETPEPDFQMLEIEKALYELKELVGTFPKDGSLNEKLSYFLMRYGNPKSIKRVDEMDGYLLSCVLANPDCSTMEASHCIWDIFDGSDDWQPNFETEEEKEGWEQCLAEVLHRIKDGLKNDTYHPHTLVWPDAEKSMDPEAPHFTPWLEGFMQGEMAFFDGEQEELSDDFGGLVMQAFEMEGEGIRLLEDRDDNPIFLIMLEILERYREGSGGSEFRFKTVGKDAWMAPEISGSEPYQREKKKVERNDPCPCGSGRKYKKCCLN